MSFIVPTTGRDSLGETLGSIEARPGDEVLVVGQVKDRVESRDGVLFRYFACPACRDWGSGERNFVTPFAKGDYLSFMDDDDLYAAGHRAAMADVMETAPGRPVLFRMRFPCGITLWYDNDREARCGNLGTPMIFMPNMPEKLGTWGSRWGGDFDFVESMKWPFEEIVWREEVIALLGHNP